MADLIPMDVFPSYQRPYARAKNLRHDNIEVCRLDQLEKRGGPLRKAHVLTHG